MNRGAEPDYYELLRVPPDATPEVIRASFRDLARRYHPDRNQGGQHEGMMEEINRAKEVLLDAAKRRDYDEARAEVDRRDRERRERERRASEWSERIKARGTEGRQRARPTKPIRRGRDGAGSAGRAGPLPDASAHRQAIYARAVFFS